MPDQSDSDFIALAKKRFKQAEEDERDIRAEAEKDLQFVAGEQWDRQLKDDRVAARRPVLTFNRLPTFVQQVANEARENKGQIKFVPSDNEATEPTAKVFEGLARHVQYASKAELAYETALEYAVSGSFGYYRFLTDYCDNESDDQELQVLPVLDPFQVYGVLIPAIFGRKPTYAFIAVDMPKEEFKRDFPTSALISNGFDEAAWDGWATEDTVRIVEYWYIEEVEGQTKSGRKVKRPTVKFCKLNGVEKLPNTDTEWPGSTIPIYPVVGKQLILKGKPKLFSLVRFLREPQQLINYAKTRIAETLSTAPVSPFMVATGQITGYEKEWSRLNGGNGPIPSVLPYNIVGPDGKPLPPPARQTFEPPITSLSEFTAQEVDDLKAISGIFDQSLGEGVNDQSGTAIKSRQRQSNATNLHFTDNLERSMKEGGDDMAELLPLVYGNGPRIIKILGEDEEPDIVKINQPYMENGQQVHHDLSKGKYELIVTVGKSFSTKRQESFDMLSELFAGNPQMILWFGDIYFKNSDNAGADQMADRAKRMLQITHPGLIEDDNEQIPPAAQAKIAQAGQQLQAMHAYAQQVEQVAQKLQQEKQSKIVENQFKMDIEKLKIEAQVTIAEITTKAQESQVRLKLENDIYKELHGSAHDIALQKDDQAHQQGMAQQQQQAASESQASDQIHQAGMAQQAAENQPDDGA